MVNFNFIPALLCTFSWISVSLSEFYTVEVQSGEEVTLMCNNFSSFTSHIFWFRLADGTNVSLISSMFSSDSSASLHDGFQNGKYNMTSNSTNLFLRIKPVNSSDSGLYFCGLYKDEDPVIVSATYLNVRDVLDGLTDLTSVILGGLTVFLFMVIISLLVKIRKFHKAQEDVQNPQHSENVGSNDLTYAAPSFRPKAKSRRRPTPERELEPNVVYAATR
ncbi:uncharacterized protein [Brachyistius frenatus]|uniref:uncharacterized protein isoform X2 n=1 Tax=Brachyistius frenatus TaxID=100188 RepID=UPI0037E9ACEE